MVKDVGIDPSMVLVDHNNEETIAGVLDAGMWAGHSVDPNTKMDEHRMVAIGQKFGGERVIINSAADWGVSDPLGVPKTAAAMRRAGLGETVIAEIFWDNPVRFFAQSGRLELAALERGAAVDQRELWEGNSVLRGQSPRIDAGS